MFKWAKRAWARVFLGDIGRANGWLNEDVAEYVEEDVEDCVGEDVDGGQR